MRLSTKKKQSADNDTRLEAAVQYDAMEMRSRLVVMHGEKKDEYICR